MTPYYVYVILCEGNNLYTGYTKNLKSRFRLHTKGKGARYTRMHKPQELIYFEKHSSRAEAMKREKRIKRLNHAEKLELANSRKKTGYTRKARKSQDPAQM
jgi:putative endonuclease